MPKDIKREFLTGPRKINEIMGKLEIIINEMMADDGPVKTCAPLPGKDTRPAWEQARRDRMDQEHGIVEKVLMNGRAARKEARVANPIGTVTRTKGARGKGKGKGKDERETRCCYDCGEQGHIGVTVHTSGPKVLTRKMIKHHHGRVSVKERMLKNLRVWKTHDEGSRVVLAQEGQGRQVGRRIDSRLAVHYLAEEDEDDRCRGN